MRDDASATGATGGAPADSGNEPPADATTGGDGAGTGGDGAGTGGDGAGTGGDGAAGRPSIAPDASDAPDGAPLETSLWNGVDLSEWEGDPSVWRVEDGAIVARAPNGAISTNTFLIHRGRAFGNFALRAQIWLGAQGNSGIQYRSARLNAVDFRMTGYQVDLGAGYWGALYEELGRGVLAAASDPCAAAGRYGEWLDYEILAQGPSIVHRLAGVECVAYTEAAAGRPKEGAIGLQYHVPGGFDVRFRALTVRELPP